jgi:hypothetical protein
MSYVAPLISCHSNSVVYVACQGHSLLSLHLVGMFFVGPACTSGCQLFDPNVRSVDRHVNPKTLWPYTTMHHHES